ncbi:hypothetical protein SAMN05428965_2896 [Geodermatophilus sp. DSM 45219]|nr:hypothetical protein SAMN05428965_2896 [Geodermatophilus sp. DSM 45219]
MTQVGPSSCLKQRSKPVVSGQQGSASLRHKSGTDALLSWENEAYDLVSAWSG